MGLNKCIDPMKILMKKTGGKDGFRNCEAIGYYDNSKVFCP